MRKIKRKISLLLVLMLCFTAFVTGCGNSPKILDPPDQDQEVTDQDQSGDQNNSGSETGDSGKTDAKVEGKNKISIYKVGDDKLVFIVEGDACEGVAPIDEYTDGKDSFFCWLDANGDSSQANLGTFWANVGHMKGDEWVSYSNDYNTGIISKKNVYYAEVSQPGLCNEISFADTYEFWLRSQSGSDDKLIGEGKTSDLVKSISEEELTEIRNNLYEIVEPSKAAEADWAGIYMTDSWSDVQGMVEVSVTEKGLLHFHTTFGDTEEDYFLEEFMYDKASYDYGDYIEAQCQSQNPYLSFHYSQSEGQSPYLSFHRDDPYLDVSMEKFALWHEAPADYDDSDRFGLISQKDPEDGTYFKPATDDYILRYQDPYGCWDGSDTRPAVCINLYSFDVNGMQCDVKYKYIFENETDAKACYDYVTKNNSYSCNLAGNVMYASYDDNWFEEKMRLLPYDWYIDCHYIYNYISDESKDYYYVSKPISKQEYSVSLEDVLFWRNVPEGNHYSFESKDVTMSMNVDKDSVDLYVYDYRDYDNAMNSDTGYIRFHGRSAESITYRESYDNATGGYRYFTYVKEFTFDESVCTVNEFRYPLDDPKDPKVTLDNYKTQTPSREMTYTFDMTRVTQ